MTLEHKLEIGKGAIEYGVPTGDIRSRMEYSSDILKAVGYEGLGELEQRGNVRVEAKGTPIRISPYTFGGRRVLGLEYEVDGQKKQGIVVGFRTKQPDRGLIYVSEPINI